MDGAHNIVLIGGSGTADPCCDCPRRPGIEHDRRKVRSFSTVELVNALEQEKARSNAPQIDGSLTRLDLLILNERGYVPFSAPDGALLFHLLSKFYERTSVVSSTNLGFGEWATVFCDATQALRVSCVSDLKQRVGYLVKPPSANKLSARRIG